MKTNTKHSSSQILLLALGTMLLFLTSCGISPVRVEQRATDLEVMRLGVEQMTQPRTVAGSLQHADEARTNGELMNYALNVEDALWLSNGDKVRVRSFVNSALSVIASGRLPPCRWLDFACKHGRAAALAPFKPSK